MPLRHYFHFRIFTMTFADAAIAAAMPASALPIFCLPLIFTLIVAIDTMPLLMP